MLILGFPDYAYARQALAAAANVDCEIIELRRFPDGESLLRLPPVLPEQVIICRSLDRPNDKLVELLLAAENARALGARHLTLVAPYLCYMRQDKAFNEGEAVSQQIIGRFLAGVFDTLLTVDPHLHRISNLAEAVPATAAISLSAASQMGVFLARRASHPLIVGPDEESGQWVREVAGSASLEYVVAKKIRQGDRQVEISLPQCDYAGRDIVLVDDIGSTGATLAVAARALREAGAGRIDVLVTHALFVGDALAQMNAAGISEVWSSDSVSHSSNIFELAPLLASALK